MSVNPATQVTEVGESLRVHLKIKELRSKPGMVAPACNASTWKAKAEGVRSSRSPSTTRGVVGYIRPCLKKQKQRPYIERMKTQTCYPTVTRNKVPNVATVPILGARIWMSPPIWVL